MPNILKTIDKCKHPNSRKTKVLAKKIKRMNNREKTKMGHAIKANILGEKLIWFSNQIENTTEPITPETFLNLIQNYLSRFDEELEQITIKKSISKNRSQQHFSRESVLHMTKERELNEFNTCGIEMMDLCSKSGYDGFKNWDGNAVNVQHLEIKRISKKYLESLKEKNTI